MECGKNTRRQLGQRGEDIACEFLQSIGHIILERNWRYGHREIDIISFDAEGIHFVEVKTRRENIQVPPQENVNHQKQKNITTAAQGYIRGGKGMPPGNHEYSFDVVAVTFSGNGHSTEWFPNAYIPIFI